MFKKSLFVTFAACAVLLVMTSISFAQGTTTRFTGTVTDGTGAVVPGATVTLTNEATGTSISTTTGSNGSYTFDLIQASTYTITVEKEGFKKYVATRNPVYVNQPGTLNVALEVGDVSAVVTVENAAEVVQTSTSGNLGTTIEQQTVESLPIVGLRGRNPLDFVDFQPGVSVGANTGGGVHVNGSRDRSFNYTLDGIDINESSAGGSNFTPLRPNPDSIQEFQIVTANFTAELGRSTGAQVTFVTRSGTNEYHGNLFEYYQTPGVNANEFENNLLGIPRRKFIQHIFGGSVGGPIINPGFGEGTPFFTQMKDKAFFFVNLQFLRANETSLVERTVYTQEARNGLFRYVNGGRNNPAGTTGASVNSNGSPILPACSGTVTVNCIATYNVAGNPSGIGPDPALLNVLNSMPLPNDFSTGDGLNTAGFNFLAPQQEKQWDFVTRLDYKFADNNVIYGRYAQGRQQSFGDTVNGGGSAFPGTPILVVTDRKPKNLAINHRFSPTSNTTNEFIFGYSHFAFDFIAPETDPFYNFTFNLPTTPNTNVYGNIRAVRTLQFVDNLTWVRNSHVFKFGTNLRFGRHTDSRSSVASTEIEGVLNFSASVNNNFNGFNLPTAGSSSINANDLARLRSQINDFLGRVGTYSQAFVANPDGATFAPPGTRWQFRHFYPELDFYVQDSWKLKPNFLLDLGVRYEIKFSPSSSGLPILRPNVLVAADGFATNAVRWEEGKLFDNDFNNFSPSIGFAWDPFKKGKTSIRGNYRLAYDRFNSQVNGAQLFQSAPGNNVGVSNTSFGQNGGLLRNGLPVLTPTQTPFQLRQPAAASTITQTVFDPRAQYPEVQSFSLSFQQEIFWGNVFEANFIHKRGDHLFGAYNANQVNINAAPAGFNSFLSEFNQIRGNSSYNSSLINALYTGDPNNNAGTATFRSTNATNIANGNVASAAFSVSSRLSGSQQMIVANGFSPTLFLKYPQFGTVRVLDTNQYSRYNGLQLILKRRISNGIGLQGSYTWSISKDNGSFDPTFTVVGGSTSQSGSSNAFDINNRDLNYAWSDFDRRHVFNLQYIWELPFGKGRTYANEIPTALDWVIGGWQYSGLVNYSSGRPFTVYSGLFTYTNTTSTPANCDGCPRNLGGVQEESGTSYLFTADQRARFSQPNPGEFSNTGRNYFIGAPDFRADMSLAKKFRFTEDMNFELRIDAKNVFNAVNYGLPTTTASSSTFGRIRTSIDSSSRRIQFSGKFNF
ncbi:MAG: TonB-dependent receptor [Pyrinomonadaceae bacterium]|nr:TonB-dependent receptor [Pyrinomonadaceae bacterium]